MNISSTLLKKYNQPVPRYTSYPTVPYWGEMLPNADSWKNRFRQTFNQVNLEEGISIYIHLPFCETLCTYCGCTKKITTRHEVEPVYLNALLKEWALYVSLMQEKPLIREIHLGGGTPTFFSASNLEKLIQGILANSALHPNYQFSIEGHPNSTSIEQLTTLFNLGFRRISYGVQDNDPEVQRVINRIQPYENLVAATENARKAGFTSINFDLVYGLPRQSLKGLLTTLQQCTLLKPSRLAYYSYAHVPWASKGQRLYDESDLPNANLKMELYQTGKTWLSNQGYTDIGMDHFSLPEDDLFHAWETGKLHRNFMGYTTDSGKLLIGLGMSAISDAHTAFAQNTKSLTNYYQCIEQNQLPIFRGYLLTEVDMVFRKYILDISCQGETSFSSIFKKELQTWSVPVLEKLQQDGLVIFNEKLLTVTPLGRHFIRNICSAFDLHLLGAKNEQNCPRYSKAI